MKHYKRNMVIIMIITVLVTVMFINWVNDLGQELIIDSPIEVIDTLTQDYIMGELARSIRREEGTLVDSLSLTDEEKLHRFRVKWYGEAYTRVIEKDERLPL